ncbi:hypothetical protein LTR09_005926 [Extremus antarcticus]|uniref:TATA-box-binding protein n=1 Tax=Extremus antarcticus TaxID=702011 RepID=A0AAJ0DM36_9PEZI|nr:hypothetical protein LTR09_005926 [Extremus antarcticus]
MASPNDRTSSVSTRNSSRALPIDGPKITNIVCGVNLNCRFELKTIALYGRNVTYYPKKFNAAIIRMREPKATALVFQTGKMQVLGAKSVDDAKLAARKFARMLQKMGFSPRMEGFNVQNIVAVVDTKMIIRLEKLHHDHYVYSRWEPELFPGLVYRFHESKVKALVFTTGKVVLLGSKQEEQLDECIKLLYPVLNECRVIEQNK